MAEWLRIPEVQASVAPFVLGLFLVLLLRHFGGEKDGPKLAPAAIAAGLLMMIAWIMGIGDPLGGSTREKLFYLAAVGALVPWILALADAAPRSVRAWGVAFPVVSVLWLGERLIANALDVRLAVDIVGLIAGSWFLIWGLGRVDGPHGTTDEPGAELRAPIHLMIVGLAVSLVLVGGGGARAAQLCAATAALAGAYILVVYVDQARGRPVAAMGANRLAAACAWLPALHFSVLLGDDVPRGPLVLMLLAFALHPLAAAMHAGTGLRGRLLKPVLYGMIAVVPAAIAVLWALNFGGAPDPYSG